VAERPSARLLVTAASRRSILAVSRSALPSALVALKACSGGVWRLPPSSMGCSVVKRCTAAVWPLLPKSMAMANKSSRPAVELPAQ